MLVQPTGLEAAPWWAAAIITVIANAIALWISRMSSRREHNDTMGKVNKTNEIVAQIQVTSNGRLSEALEKISKLEAILSKLEQSHSQSLTDRRPHD